MFYNVERLKLNQIVVVFRHNRLTCGWFICSFTNVYRFVNDVFLNCILGYGTGEW